jgi:UPF0716 protein FxsA
MRVIGGLLVWTVAEISAFVVVGGWIGLFGVLALVLGTGVAGVMVLRRQGVRLAGAMQRPQAMRAAGEAGLVAFGAVLLILPGLLTDLFGLALMVPVVRRWVMAQIAVRTVVTRSYDAAADVVEATAVEVETGALRPPSGWTKP